MLQAWHMRTRLSLPLASMAGVKRLPPKPLHVESEALPMSNMLKPRRWRGKRKKNGNGEG